MAANSHFLPVFNTTATANYNTDTGRIRRSYTKTKHRSELPSQYSTISVTRLGSETDPEEDLLDRLLVAEQSKKKAEAHARINAKRLANPIDELLELLSNPEYKIEVDDMLLCEILDSFPEDD